MYQYGRRESQVYMQTGIAIEGGSSLCVRKYSFPLLGN